MFYVQTHKDLSFRTVVDLLIQTALLKRSSEAECRTGCYLKIDLDLMWIDDQPFNEILDNRAHNDSFGVLNS